MGGCVFGGGVEFRQEFKMELLDRDAGLGHRIALHFSAGLHFTMSLGRKGKSERHAFSFLGGAGG